MSKLTRKTALVVSALLGATAYAFAQMSPDGPTGTCGQMQQGGMMEQMHQQMMQGQGGMHSGTGGHSGMHGAQSGAAGTPIKPRARRFRCGIEINVTGEGRTLEAIKRMVPAHVNELREIGWNAKSDELPNGVTLTVMASETQPLTKLRALGFMGVMVQGSHHQHHHLLMAMGKFVH